MYTNPPPKKRDKWSGVSPPSVSSLSPILRLFCSFIVFCQSQQQNGRSRKKTGRKKRGGQDYRLAFRAPRGPLSLITNERAAKHQPCSLSSPSPSVSPGSFVHEESNIMALWEGVKEGGRRCRRQGTRWRRWGNKGDEGEVVGWWLWRFERDRRAQPLQHGKGSVQKDGERGREEGRGKERHQGKKRKSQWQKVGAAGLRATGTKGSSGIIC